MSSFYLARDGVKRTQLAYITPTSKGHGIAFDSMEAVQEGGDPVDLLCKWCLSNLEQDQIEKLCESLSIPHRSASLEGMDGEGEGVTGYPGGRRDGPQAGNAGPWQSQLGTMKKNGVQDGWSRLRDFTKREERAYSFDSIFGSDDRGPASDGGRADGSFEGLFGLGGDGGERAPSVDHLGHPAPLWVTMR